MLDKGRWTVYRDPKCSCEPDGEKCKSCKDLIMFKDVEIKSDIDTGFIHCPYIPYTFTSADNIAFFLNTDEEGE